MDTYYDPALQREKVAIETTSASVHHRKSIIENVFLVLLYHIGLLELLVENDITDLTAFEWLSFPKFAFYLGRGEWD